MDDESLEEKFMKGWNGLSTHEKIDEAFNIAYGHQRETQDSPAEFFLRAAANNIIDHYPENEDREKCIIRIIDAAFHLKRSQTYLKEPET